MNNFALHDLFIVSVLFACFIINALNIYLII